MAKPPFTMSKYLNELDLQRDARAYYQNNFEAAEKDIKDLNEFIETLEGDRDKLLDELEKISSLGELKALLKQYGS